MRIIRSGRISDEFYESLKGMAPLLKTASQSESYDKTFGWEKVEGDPFKGLSQERLIQLEIIKQYYLQERDWPIYPMLLEHMKRTKESLDDAIRSMYHDVRNALSKGPPVRFQLPSGMLGKHTLKTLDNS